MALEEMLNDVTRLAGLLKDRSDYTFGAQEPIRHVVMIIVVEAEVAPILAKLDFTDDEAATADFMGLARVRSGMYGSYKLSVLKVAWVANKKLEISNLNFKFPIARNV